MLTPDALLARSHDFDLRAQADDLCLALAAVYRLLAEMAQPDLTTPHIEAAIERAAYSSGPQASAA